MEEMTIMMDKMARIRRHDLLVSPRDRKLGLVVHGIGSRIAPAHTTYQVFEKGAPYQWQHGRIISDYGLVYIVEGGGYFRSRGARKLRVQTGDIILLQPGVWHDYFPDARTGWREFWVTFDGGHAAQLLAPLQTTRHSPVLRPGLDGTLCELFGKMIEAARDKPPFVHVFLSGLLLQLLSTLLGKLQLQDKGGRQEHAIVRQARRNMELHFSEPIDMSALAHSLHVSYRHFRRIFKAATGMPPHQYLLNIRIIQARRLLEEKNIKISTLAALVGFDDPYHFSRVFKQKTGIAPARWRE